MLSSAKFLDLLTNFYLHLKALHILSVIAWMAGLLYLPRLFVYHVENLGNKDLEKVFLTMEERLLRIIMLPSMIATFLFGGLLLLIPGIVQWNEGWIHLKLLLVFSLAGLHGMMISCWKDLKAGKNQKTALFFRYVNEIPFFLAIVVVFLVILKPF
ncbi:MAG: protoporphyrinogen oxidase HemJ [Holosporales bacterium]|nr:protoporphyrinogen oxidase HemJ [Holosporales bacterium]